MTRCTRSGRRTTRHRIPCCIRCRGCPGPVPLGTGSPPGVASAARLYETAVWEKARGQKLLGGAVSWSAC